MRMLLPVHLRASREVAHYLFLVAPCPVCSESHCTGDSRAEKNGNLLQVELAAGLQHAQLPLRLVGHLERNSPRALLFNDIGGSDVHVFHEELADSSFLHLLLHRCKTHRAKIIDALLNVVIAIGFHAYYNSLLQVST